MSGLQSHGDDRVARCKICGATAAGPCARCRAMVCADCSELTTGGASTFAVCTSCARTAGASLASAWRGLFGWLALIIVGIAAAGIALYLLAGCGRLGWPS